MATKKQQQLFAMWQNISLPVDFKQQWYDELMRILRESNWAKVFMVFMLFVCYVASQSNVIFIVLLLAIIVRQIRPPQVDPPAEVDFFCVFLSQKVMVC